MVSSTIDCCCYTDVKGLSNPTASCTIIAIVSNELPSGDVPSAFDPYALLGRA